MKSRLVLFFLLLFTAFAHAQTPSFEGYKTINGCKLYCKVIGEGEPMLIIHGGPGMAHDYFLPYMLPLAKTNKLIFYDQRSTGRSDIPKDSFGASHKKMVDDIEGLRKAFGIKKLNIMAHSWASKLAVNYALKYPANLKSIVFVSPAPLNHEYDAAMQKYTTDKKYEPQFKEAKDKVMNMQVGGIEVRMRLAFLSLMYVPENIEKLKLVFPPNYGDLQRSLFAGLGSDFRKYDMDYYPMLTKIKCPVLLIHGNADATPLEAEQRLVSGVANGKMVQMEHSGHFPFIEEEDIFAENVSSFVNAIK
jgi:proline iminopeptidase